MSIYAGNTFALVAPQTQNLRADNLPDRSPTQRASVEETTSSFAQQLASAIEQYLGSTDPGASVQIEIRPGQSQNSGSRQFFVTVTDKTATASPAAAPTPTPETPVRRSLFGETMPWIAPTPSKPPMPYPNSREAYWAAQPPEVQEMRNIPETGSREAKASELAARGFTIDYPIMVWQWDPLSTMRARINSGYTWVPAVGQPSIEVTAGATFPGRRTYDPSNPPPGSIPVSIAFAKGYDS